MDRYFPDYAQEHYRYGDKVVFLPDIAPVSPDYLIRAKTEVKAKKPGRIRFLLFGALQRRKGIYETLDAVSRLEPEIAERVDLRFCGKVTPECADFPACLEGYAANSRADLHLVDKFLTTDELANEIASSDVVLAPYVQHKGSSGVLYWAAAFAKPVIAQKEWLVGREVREFGLGATLTSGNAIELAKEISATVESGKVRCFSVEGTRKYIEGHSMEAFASKIIEVLYSRCF